MCVEGVTVNVGQADESLYIALFVASGSVKKLFLTDFVDIYLFSMFFSIVFAVIYLLLVFFSIDFIRWKNVGLLHIAYVVIH